MAEATSNVEFAHKIHERGHHRSPATDRREQWIEIAEAVVLAIVAIATAWSGYQAAKWDALSAKYYQLASRTNVAAEGRRTLAGQDRLYDTVTFNGWIAAKMAGDGARTGFFERRFRPEYTAAFVVWQKLDPFNNLTAPAGPIFMPEYVNANAQQAETLTEQGEHEFEQGVTMRETGDEYVRITVLLATVLLLTALSQRFEIFGPRIAVVGVAAALLVISIYSIATFARA